MSASNQFYQHPLPGVYQHLLGAGAIFVKEAATAGVDYLITPPPPNSDVVRVFDDLLLVNTTGDDIPVAEDEEYNWLLVYKSADGEAIIASFNDALDDGATLSLQATTLITLRPTDRGIYLRIAAPDVAGLTAFSSFNDLRGVNPVYFNLTTSPQTVLEGPTNEVRLIARGGEEFEHSYFVASNFDSVDHTVVVSLTDGDDTIQLLSEVVPAGEAAKLIDNSFPPRLLEGWSLLASMTVAASTLPCVLSIGYTDTNLHPVRQWQGGAY